MLYAVLISFVLGVTAHAAASSWPSLPAMESWAGEQIVIAELDCENLSLALENYQDLSLQNEKLITTHLGNMGQSMSTWHIKWERFEGLKQPIPMGQFKVLADSAEQAEENIENLETSSEVLGEHVRTIAETLYMCIDPSDESQMALVAQLEAYDVTSRENERAISSLMSAMKDHLSRWHGLWQPLEGREVLFPEGSFSEIALKALVLREAQSLSRENSDVLQKRLSQIIRDLKKSLVNDPT